MGTEPVERGRLAGNVRIDNILLEEAVSVKERREGLTDVKVVPVKGPLLEPRPLTGPVMVL